MSSSQSPTSPSHPGPVSLSSGSRQVRRLPGLKADLQKVAAARGNVYGQKMGILVYWDKDDTRAKDDIKTMRKVLEYFGVESTVHVLQTSDRAPGWSLSGHIRKMLLDRQYQNQNTLFVFYYVGHGSLINGKLNFSSGKKVVAWSQVHGDLFANLEILRRVDALGILDCCFAAAAATRQRTSRTTQILAACGADEEAKSRSQSISFTQRLFRAVQSLKSRAPTMTTTALFDEIQGSKPRDAPHAVFTTLTGSQPITLAFQGAASSATPSRIPIRASRRVNEKHVLVKLTVLGDSRDFPEAFQSAIRDLPANMKVEVTDAYETDQSVFLILGMSWEAWALWTMVADLDLIGVTLGPSLMHKNLVEVQNLPFRERGKG